MLKDELIARILKSLSHLTTEIKMNNGAGRMDLNKTAEDFFCGLLNIILGNSINLTNMNHIHNDFPAIDLGDPHHGIAVQVTATEKRDKIRTTLKKFFENNLDLIYPNRLIILIIGRAENYSKDFTLERGYSFDPAKDIWDEVTLGREINMLDLERLVVLDSYLATNLPQHSQEAFALHLPVPSAVGLGCFVGRKEEICLIEQSLNIGVKPIILSGLGGIGKTELVSEFARNYSNGNIYFVTFRKTFTKTLALGITEGMSDLPPQLTEEQTCQYVLKKLQELNKSDILIIDNVYADNISFHQLLQDPMYQQLSRLSTGLIFTTRYDIPKSVQIEKLKNEELYQVFHSYGVSISKTNMDNLIEAVNGHTLTVDLMARMMVGSWKRVTAEQLLTALKEKSLRKFQRKIGTDHNRDIEQRIIYDHLKAVFDLAEIPDSGKNVLRYATLLPDNGINTDSFGAALSENEEPALDDLIQNGWLCLKGELLYIHPIIRIVCQEDLQPTAESCEPFLAGIYEQHNPNLYNSTLFRQWAELFTIASETIPDSDGRWLLVAGHFWDELGIPDKALKIHLELVHLHEGKPKINPKALALSYYNLAHSYGELGNYDKELEYAQKALGILDQSHIMDEQIIARLYNSIGLAYSNLDDPVTALRYLQKALKIDEQMLPDTHPELAHTYNNIGGVYGQLNDHHQALNFMTKALNIREKTLTRDHLMLASSYNNVGYTYGELGDLEKALYFMLKALEIRKQTLPDSHPDLSTSFNNVGYTYGCLGDNKNALINLEIALAIREKILPQQHPDLAASHDNISDIYNAIGNYEKALEHQMQALYIWEQRLPDTHTQLAHVYNKIGVLYGQVNNPETELEYLLKALRIWEQPLPEYTPMKAIVYGNIASTLIQLKQFEEAARYAHLSSQYATMVVPKGDTGKEFYSLLSQSMDILATHLENEDDTTAFLADVVGPLLS